MKYVAIDYETVEKLPTGELIASLDFYKASFRVTSCAFAWYGDNGEIRTKYEVGEAKIRARLRDLSANNIPVIAHNQQFEYGVTLCRFPDIRLNWEADTMRLAQLYDNGGDKYAPAPLDPDELWDEDEDDKVQANPLHGLRLSACSKRILCENDDHKERAYAVLRGLGVQAGKEAASLHLLPPADMEAYNVADAVNTLRLYKFITTEFASQEYDWRVDNSLFQFMLDRLVRSKIEGVEVDRALIYKSIQDVADEMERIKQDFATKMAEPIKAVEKDLLKKRLSKYKTGLGRDNYLARGEWKEECKFNARSTTQLTKLFVVVLGMTPKFLTKKKKPSFRSAVLSQWGEGGIILQKLKKRGIIHAQLLSLHALSEYDGKWHLDIKLCGTSTGRMAGGSHE